MHRVLSEWGEGSSMAGGNEGQGGPSANGDATWIHRSYPDSLWLTVGGDFVPSASAEANVGGPGTYTFGPTPELNTDILAWITNPASNFGWIIVGDENTAGSAKRFDSRDNSSETVRPVLRLKIRVPTARAEDTPEGRTWLSQNYPNPFAHRTTITYSVASAGDIRFEIFDALGRAVREYHVHASHPGSYRFGIDSNGLAPGWYVYRLTAGQEILGRTFVVTP
jgi:hypothetical protein